jgi:cation transport regulator ChaC
MKYIFGYGSLTNPQSLKRTLPGEREIIPMTLRGYQRKMNAPVGRHVYLNIVANDAASITGVAFGVSDDELSRLIDREVGYALADISSQVDPPLGNVFAFVMPDGHHPNHAVLQTYIDTCVRHLSEDERDIWFAETIIENIIIDDRSDPEYTNAG